MDSQGQSHAGLSRILRKYRKVVRILRILPFAYLCLVALIAFASDLLPESLSALIDCTLFISPVVSVSTLLLSGILGMCRWHKAASLLPYSSRVVSFIDTNFFTFTQNELVIINFAIGVMLTAFIALAFNHFLGCTTSSKT